MPVEGRQFQFKNNSRSTLAAGITASQTELTVQPNQGDRFPSVDPTYDEIFAVMLFSGSKYEICYCTSRNGDILTVERAKEGTTAQAFSAGATVVHNVTAGFWEQFVTQPPTTPVLSAEQTDDTEITLSWTAAVPAAGVTIAEYDIYRQDNGGAFSLIDTVDGSTLGYVDSGLSLGHTYGYYIVAVTSAGPNSANSNTASVFLPVPTYLMLGNSNVSAIITELGFQAQSDPALTTTTRAVAYDGVGRWVMCGTSPGRVSVTDDQGATWVEKAHGLGQNFEEMDYAFGAFWMGSNNGSCFTSPNGEAPWTARMTGSRAYGVWYSPGEDRIACCGDLNSATDTPTIQYADSLGAMSSGSTTGLATGGSDPGNTLFGIGRDDSRGNWWVCDGNGKVSVTDDIVAGTWTLVDTIDAAASGGLARFAFQPNGAIVIVTGLNGIWVSTDDGASFHEVEVGSAFSDVLYSDFFGAFYVVGDDTKTSTDGETWTIVDAGSYRVIGEGVA